MGACSYTLVNVPGVFDVTVENVPCGSTGVTCTKSVTVTIASIKIHLVRDKDLVIGGTTFPDYHYR